MVILYIETNFLMGIAQGQDIAAQDLVNHSPDSLRIVIPSICFLEALTTFNQEKRNRQEFKQELDKQINKATRNLASLKAQNLVLNLQQALILNQSVLNEINYSLYDIIDKLIDKAEIINLSSNILRNLAEYNLIEPEELLIKNDLIDNLILMYILDHANANKDTNKVFLSSNTNDFGKQEVQTTLRSAGVRYFSKTQDFLGWLQTENT